MHNTGNVLQMRYKLSSFHAKVLQKPPLGQILQITCLPVVQRFLGKQPAFALGVLFL